MKILLIVVIVAALAGCLQAPHSRCNPNDPGYDVENCPEVDDG